VLSPWSILGTVEIDRRAPVVLEKDVEIRAEAEAVWNVLIDVERWPTGNPEVSSAHLDGPLAEGSTFPREAGSIDHHLDRRAHRPASAGRVERHDVRGSGDPHLEA
jgi:hypothetical protein